MTNEYNHTLYWKAKRPRLEGSSDQRDIADQSTVAATTEELEDAFGLFAPAQSEAVNQEANANNPFLIEETQLPETYPEIDDEESDELDEAAVNLLLVRWFLNRLRY